MNAQLFSRRWSPIVACLVVVAGVLGVALRPTSAQTDAVKRAVLVRAADPGSATHEVMLVRVELAPGASVGKHFHHGLETGILLEGAVSLEISGAPAKRLKAGDGYEIGVQATHDARNTGTTPAKLLAVYVTEKGKPLAEPVK